jgi:hypothetical protein
MTTTSKKQPFGGKQATPFGKKGDKSRENKPPKTTTKKAAKK